MKWFQYRFPNHPLSKASKTTKTKMVVQTIRGIQETKDAGAERYRLLSLIFTKELGMVPATGNKGLFIWHHNGHKALLALATDDIIIAVSHKSLYHVLCATFQSLSGSPLLKNC